MKFLLPVIFIVVVAQQLVTANTVCPGAPESSYGRGTLECSRPDCPQNGCGMHPSTDPTKYFVCIGQKRSLNYACDHGTCFSWTHQGCVQPMEWTDSCKPIETTEATTEDSTTESTTVETTTATEERVYDCLWEPNCKPIESRGRYFPTPQVDRWTHCNEDGLGWSSGTCSQTGPALLYFTIIDEQPACVELQHWVNLCPFEGGL